MYVHKEAWLEKVLVFCLMFKGLEVRNFQTSGNVAQSKFLLHLYFVHRDEISPGKASGVVWPSGWIRLGKN